MHRIILSGFGGQGMLLAGQLLAYAGMLEGKNVTWMPSYGPEMRGGSANCSVIISKDAIGSPVISKPDILVAMNQPSYTAFQGKVAPGGILLYNSSLVSFDSPRQDIRVIGLDATNMANDMKNSRVANMIALGSLVELTGCVDPKSILQALSIKFGEGKKHLLAINEEALQQGACAVKEQAVIA